MIDQNLNNTNYKRDTEVRIHCNVKKKARVLLYIISLQII